MNFLVCDDNTELRREIQQIIHTISIRLMTRTSTTFLMELWLEEEKFWVSSISMHVVISSIVFSPTQSRKLLK